MVYIICSLTSFTSKHCYVLSKIFLAFLVKQLFWQFSRLDDFTINAVASIFVHESPNIIGAYSETNRASKMELFSHQWCKNSQWLKVSDYFCKKPYLSCLTGLWVHLCIFFSRDFLYTFREGSFAGKKLGESRNEFLQMFGGTLPKKLLLLPKSLYIISLNKEIKWLKFLFASLLKAKK